MKPAHRGMYERLFDRIASGQYRAGVRLKEQALARDFRVSRTPAREALRMLAADGLVRLLPNRGASVVGLTVDSVEEIFDIRKALEMLAVECAASRVNLDELSRLRTRVARMAASPNAPKHTALDADFHGFILASCGRPRLAAILDQHFRLMQQFRYLGFKGEGVITRATQDHLDIVDALLARDAERAKAAVARHIEATKRTVLTCLATQGQRDRRVEAARRARTRRNMR